VLELEPAAADISEILAEQSDGRIGGDLRAGFVDLLLVDEYLAGENQSLGSFAGRDQAAFYEKLVKSKFQWKSLNAGLESSSTFCRRVREKHTVPQKMEASSQKLYHEGASPRFGAKC
jgi:hypothetical protein